MRPVGSPGQADRLWERRERRERRAGGRAGERHPGKGSGAAGGLFGEKTAAVGGGCYAGDGGSP